MKYEIDVIVSINTTISVEADSLDDALQIGQVFGLEAVSVDTTRLPCPTHDVDVEEAK